MTDAELLAHKMEIRELEEKHSREENEAEHRVMSGRIDSVCITVDGHEVRISTLEGRATQLKAKAVDTFVKWALGVIATFAGGGVLFYLGTIFGGGK
jgi:uncharacterized membrane protein YjjP (DUF1212 family)